MKKLLCVALLILISAPPLWAVPQGWGDGWSDYSVLSTASLISPAPDVLTDSKGNYHIFWLDKTKYNIQIKYMMIDQKGHTIQTPYFITNDTEWAVKDYAIFLDEHNHIQVFYGVLFNGDFQLRYSQMSPGKNANSYQLIKEFYRPFQGLNGVKDSSGQFHLFWSNSDTGNHELYYSKLSSDLKLLIDAKLLSVSKGMTTASNSAIDSKDRIHIVYNDNRLDTSWNLEYMVLDNNGNPLIYPKIISQSMKYEDHITPVVTIDQLDQAYIFWGVMNRGGYGSRNFDTYYTVITSDLQLKYSPIMLSEHPNSAYAIAYPPSTFVDQDNQIHTVWADSIIDPINVFYKVIKEDQVIIPLEQLAVSLTAFVRPSLQIDKLGNKHLFFMEIIDQGLTNLAYMSTSQPAAITYWHLAGLDEDNLLFSTLFRLIRNLSFAAIGVLLNAVAIFVATILLLFMDKYKIQIPYLLKGLLLVVIILLVQLTPLTLTVIGIPIWYKILAILLATVLFLLWLYFVSKKLKFADVFSYLLGGVLFVYLYIFITLWPAQAMLIR